jgi:hypothetical protein
LFYLITIVTINFIRHNISTFVSKFFAAIITQMITEDMFCSDSCKDNTLEIPHHLSSGCCPSKNPNSPFMPKCINPSCDNNCEEFTYEGTDIMSYKIYCNDCYQVEQYMIRLIQTFISCIH